MKEKSRATEIQGVKSEKGRKRVKNSNFNLDFTLKKSVFAKEV